MVPPQDMPDGKKSIDRPALRFAQREARYASSETSAGNRMTRPVMPERIARFPASTWVATCTWRRNAAVRSAFRSAAVSTAKLSSFAREVARGTAGRMIAASRPMMASTHSISISAKPAAPLSRGRRAMASARTAGDVAGRSTAAFLSVGAERDDVVRRALAGRAIDIAMAPRVVRDHAAAQVRAVPALRVGRPRQRGKTLGGGRIASKVEIVEVQRAGKALDLDPGRLRLRLAEIA